MNKPPVLLLAVLMAALLAAWGCSPSTELPGPAAVQPSATEAPTLSSPAELEAQLEEEVEVSKEDEDATETPTSVTETPEDDAAVSSSEDACVACHTDQQMLVDNAKPEEEVVSENEGAG